ncbi:MAG TPA: nickel-binding protein [Longimicrobiales bacterium]|nr:nickel-binding protein [Longimicrobiales bacterium]
MARVIVERIFDPPLTEAEHMARSQRLNPCLEPSKIRWIRSFVSNDRRHGVCEFEAADAETVRVAHRTAEVPFTRVWTGQVFDPEMMADSQ